MICMDYTWLVAVALAYAMMRGLAIVLVEPLIEALIRR